MLILPLFFNIKQYQRAMEFTITPYGYNFYQLTYQDKN